MELRLIMNTPDGLRAIRALRRFVEYDSHLLRQGDADYLRALCDELERARDRYLQSRLAQPAPADRLSDDPDAHFRRVMGIVTRYGWAADRRKATRGQRPAWYVEYCKKNLNV